MPRPIEPALRCFEGGHLGFGVGFQGFLVVVRIVCEVGIGIGAIARWTVIGGGTISSRIGGGKGAFPAGTATDVVEIFRTIRVGLRPLATDRWSPAVRSLVHSSYLIRPGINEGLPCVRGIDFLYHVVPVIADELDSVCMFQDGLAGVEDGILIDRKSVV